ncbi:MAG: cytochrome c oxidase assembly protein subunit 15 [Gallionellaceae bacterium]|nr:MAG: cytochrome c oxidase assembly protein subunit 15 [Gallionellaceae bacterium]
MTDGNRTLHVLIALTFTLMVAVVMLSAYMRLSATGLGCDNWPDCYGRILAGHAPHRPEWINIAHRIAASAMGLAALAIATLAWRLRRTAHRNFPLALALFGLTAFLAALGKWTHDARLPAVALGNLLGGLGMLLLLWRMHLGYSPQTAAPSGLRGWIRIGLMLVAAQAALGGMTSANFAVSSCAGLNGCEGWLQHATLAAFNPFHYLGVTQEGSFVPGATQQTLHMAHRLLALPVVAYLVWLGIGLFREKWRRSGQLLIAVAALQVALGIGAATGNPPLFLVLLHNAAAAFLLLALLTFSYRPRDPT